LDYLREVAKRVGQGALAQESGISRQHLYVVLSGKAAPTDGNAQQSFARSDDAREGWRPWAPPATTAPSLRKPRPSSSARIANHHNVAKNLPRVALESRHPHLFDRLIVGGLVSTAIPGSNIGNLRMQVRGLPHYVLAGEVIAALL
jgi:hypothetical protein